MAVRLAVVGATGAVGELIRSVILEYQIPFESIIFLASARSAGKSIEWNGKTYHIEPISPEKFRDVNLVLSSTPSSVSKEFSPVAAAAGAIVVDNSSAWRMDPQVPLVVPEVNSHELANIPKRIIANPNCVAIPLTVALNPLRAIAPIQRVVVSTYQSSSGKGAKGLADFEAQVEPWAQNQPVPAPTSHKAQLAGNVITLDWTLDANGYTEEENKVIAETCKILNQPELKISPTCVRVPVKISHSISANVEFSTPVSAEKAKEILAAAPGVVLLDEWRGEFPQPLLATGSDATFVGRVRHDPGNPNALNLWIVADNLRKGAASNAVQIAKKLIQMGLVG
ncbi:MAG: aspartate-semialdehyde dehydrogenase [Zavarzinella sp.]